MEGETGSSSSHKRKTQPYWDTGNKGQDHAKRVHGSSSSGDDEGIMSESINDPLPPSLLLPQDRDHHLLQRHHHDLFMSALRSAAIKSGHMDPHEVRHGLSLVSKETNAIVRQIVHTMGGGCVKVLRSWASGRFPGVKDLRVNIHCRMASQAHPSGEWLVPNPSCITNSQADLSGLQSLTIRMEGPVKHLGSITRGCTITCDPLSLIIMPIITQTRLIRLELVMGFRSGMRPHLLPSIISLLSSPTLSSSLQYLTLIREKGCSLDNVVADTLQPVLEDPRGALSSLVSLKIKTHKTRRGNEMQEDMGYCHGMEWFLRGLSHRHYLPSLKELELDGSLGVQSDYTSNLCLIATEGLDLSHLTTLRVNDAHALRQTPIFFLQGDNDDQQVALGQVIMKSCLDMYFSTSYNLAMPQATMTALYKQVVDHDPSSLSPGRQILAMKLWLARMTGLPIIEASEAHAATTATIISCCYPLADPMDQDFIRGWLSSSDIPIVTKVLALLLFQNDFMATSELLLSDSVSLAIQHHTKGVATCETAQLLLLKCLQFVDPLRLLAMIHADTTLESRLMEVVGMTSKDIVKDLLQHHDGLSLQVRQKLAMVLLYDLPSYGQWRTLYNEVWQMHHELILLLIGCGSNGDKSKTRRECVLDESLSHMLADDIQQPQERDRDGWLYDALFVPHRWEGLWSSLMEINKVIGKNLYDDKGYLIKLVLAARERGLGLPPSSLLFPPHLITDILSMTSNHPLPGSTSRSRQQRHPVSKAWCRSFLTQCFGGLHPCIEIIVEGMPYDPYGLKVQKPRQSMEVMDVILSTWVVMHDDDKDQEMDGNEYDNTFHYLQDKTNCIEALPLRLLGNITTEITRWLPTTEQWYVTHVLSMNFDDKIHTALKAITIIAKGSHAFASVMCDPPTVNTPHLQDLLSILVVAYATARLNDGMMMAVEGELVEKAVVSLARCCPEKVVVGLLVGAGRENRVCGNSQMNAFMSFNDAVVELLQAIASPHYHNTIPTRMITAALDLKLAPPSITRRYVKAVQYIANRIRGRSGTEREESKKITASFDGMEL